METQPLEICAFIFSFLQKIKDVNSVSIVNKKFLKAILNHHIWKRMISIHFMSKDGKYHLGPLNLHSCIEPKFKHPEKSKTYASCKSLSDENGDIFYPNYDRYCDNPDHFDNSNYKGKYDRNIYVKIAFTKTTAKISNKIWTSSEEKKYQKLTKKRESFLRLKAKYSA